MCMFGCILGDFILYLVFIEYIFFGCILFGVNFVCICVVYWIGLLDDDLYIFWICKFLVLLVLLDKFFNK